MERKPEGSGAATRGEGDPEGLAGELRDLLRQDPGLWPDILRAVSQEEPTAVRALVLRLRETVTERAVPVLVDQLENGDHREIRIDAAMLLSGSGSSAAFSALIGAARSDPDSGVRYAALAELAREEAPLSTAERSQAIDQAVRRSAETDSDPGVRRTARVLLGEPTDPSPSWRGRSGGGQPSRDWFTPMSLGPEK